MLSQAALAAMTGIDSFFLEFVAYGIAASHQLWTWTTTSRSYAQSHQHLIVTFDLSIFGVRSRGFAAWIDRLQFRGRTAPFQVGAGHACFPEPVKRQHRIIVAGLGRYEFPLGLVRFAVGHSAFGCPWVELLPSVADIHRLFLLFALHPFPASNSPSRENLSLYISTWASQIDTNTFGHASKLSGLVVSLFDSPRQKLRAQYQSRGIYKGSIDGPIRTSGHRCHCRKDWRAKEIHTWYLAGRSSGM